MRPSIVNMACLQNLLGRNLTITLECAIDSKHKDVGRVYTIQLDDAYVTSTGTLVIEGMNEDGVMEHIDGIIATIENDAGLEIYEHGTWMESVCHKACKPLCCVEG